MRGLSNEAPRQVVDRRAIPTCTPRARQFKRVNDALGFGDMLLAKVAERLVGKVTRDGDLVVRLGGDEFALLLRGGDAALGVAVAQRIHVELPHKLGALLAATFRRARSASRSPRAQSWRSRSAPSRRSIA